MRTGRLLSMLVVLLGWMIMAFFLSSRWLSRLSVTEVDHTGSDHLGKAGQEFPQQMDIVITYVNGSDPNFLRGLSQVQAEGRDVSFPTVDPSRFRDNEELRYALRSIEMYAGNWLRNIVLVISNASQVPFWLQVAHPRLRLVLHHEFLPLQHLPTFNSAAIEAGLHHISNLTEPFLFQNDDFFYGAPVRREDLLSKDGKPRIFLHYISYRLKFLLPWSRLSPRDTLMLHTMSLLAKRLNVRSFYWGDVQHAPYVYSSKIWSELDVLFGPELRETEKARLRGEGHRPITAPNLYAWYSWKQGLAERQGMLSLYTTTYLAMLSSSRALRFWTIPALRLLRPKFFCLNDDASQEGRARLQSYLLEFLQDQFPRPSLFEKVDS
eukprot:gb/GEZN01008710.1/.p1 GENE.gb/GEZN01008710.1/~~gb/GEZN01008710.1/.p1  ORF type:complete len:442 (+),score=27.83 gb/GEZN01008710.1/:190-1326(+)